MADLKQFEHHTDWQIIQEILAGKTALFELLIRRNNPFLYKTGRSCNYSREDTEDLMQETFISAYAALPKFENRSSFRTWIIRIMLNKCHRRREKLSFSKEQAGEKAINENAIPMYSSEHSDTGKAVANKELRHVIENALSRVPEEYRLVFSLREISGLNVAETAEALEISEANVKTRLSRAKNMLRKEIEKTYTAEELFGFNLVYCDAMVERVMSRIKS